MNSLLMALAVFLAGGIGSLVTGRKLSWALAIGPLGIVAGCALVSFDALGVLIEGETLVRRVPATLPLASWNLGLDPLSAVFALAIALVSALAAIYGARYLRHEAGGKNLGVHWFFFHVLVASMFLVVTARNGVFFLIAWEVMTLSSFFLVMFESENPKVRQAGWTYLVAAHLGTCFLLAMFALLGSRAKSLDFELLDAAPGAAGAIFLLAVIGFGTKAGFLPLHVWLPEAHPAAPSHVSAVMSGVMIKTGIYGIFRVLVILGPGPAWWGWTLLGIGAVSGILGVLFALAQHDLKRLLAYHSVENIGIIAMGMGLGLLGIANGNAAMAMLGMTGALFHVVNHALFKSLLFLGAGAVFHATGLREIDQLGGLLKRMPRTGAAFLVGAAAISGLPPLNGFASEWLIYLGALRDLVAAQKSAVAWPLAGFLVLGSLALIGGLATVCFTKTFGIVFLGEPRSAAAREAHEAKPAMRVPMEILAAACVGVAVLAPLAPRILSPAVSMMMPPDTISAAERPLEIYSISLLGVLACSFLLVSLAGGLMLLRRRLLSGRTVDEAPTWDCGYAAPTPRMQYTSSSFAWPLVELFRLFLQSRADVHPPHGLFPTRASLHTETPDLFRERLYRPVFWAIDRVAIKLHWLQQGRIQLYVLYIALTLLVLFAWKLG